MTDPTHPTIQTEAGRVLTDRAGGLRPEPAAQSQPGGAHPSRICPTCGGESRFEGRCGACIMADYEDDCEDQCYWCGGDGFVTSCFSDYACRHPEDGCEECTFRCDVCNPRPRDSDGSGEAGETRSGSTEGDSAGPQGIAQPQDAQS